MNWKEAVMLVFTISLCAAALFVVAPHIDATITESKPLDIVSTITSIIAVAIVSFFIALATYYIRSFHGTEA